MSADFWWNSRISYEIKSCLVYNGSGQSSNKIQGIRLAGTGGTYYAGRL